MEVSDKLSMNKKRRTQYKSLFAMLLRPNLIRPNHSLLFRPSSYPAELRLWVRVAPDSSGLA